MARRTSADKKLLAAAKAGDIGGVRASLAEGARELDTALIRAASGGHVEAIGYLLDHGANIAYALHAGPTPGDALREAARNGRAEAVRLLLDRGADPRSFGGKPLAVASAHGDPETVKLLLDAGADPRDGAFEAIQAALSHQRPDAIRELLRREFLKEGPNEWRDQMLMEGLRAAVWHSDLAMIEGLLDGGLDPGVGKNAALRLASKRGQGVVARLLIDRGADPVEAAKWNTPEAKALLAKLAPEGGRTENAVT